MTAKSNFYTLSSQLRNGEDFGPIRVGNVLVTIKEKADVGQLDSWFYSTNDGATWTLAGFSGNTIVGVRMRNFSGVAGSSWSWDRANSNPPGTSVTQETTSTGSFGDILDNGDWVGTQLTSVKIGGSNYNHPIYAVKPAGGSWGAVVDVTPSDKINYNSGVVQAMGSRALIFYSSGSTGYMKILSAAKVLSAQYTFPGVMTAGDHKYFSTGARTGGYYYMVWNTQVMKIAESDTPTVTVDADFASDPLGFNAGRILLDSATGDLYMIAETTAPAGLAIAKKPAGGAWSALTQLETTTGNCLCYGVTLYNRVTDGQKAIGYIFRDMGNGTVGYYGEYLLTEKAPLAGSGALTATGSPVGHADFSGEGSFAGDSNLAGSAKMSGGSSLATDGTIEVISQAPFAGGGALAGVASTTVELTGDGSLTVVQSLDISATPQPIRLNGGLGYFSLPPVMVLSIPDAQLDYAPTVVVVYLSGAPEGTVVTFAVGGVDVATVTAGTDVTGPLSLPVDDQSATEVTARATGCVCNPVAITFAGTAPADVTDPGPDADPVAVPAAVVDGTIYRWVLQDLMPGGLGSYVFPANPKSMQPLPVQKTLDPQHTSGIDGQFHVTEAAWQPFEWAFSGVCTTKEFHDTIQQYFELNRRFYLIDHRNRAWLVTFLEPDFEFRLRSEVDGVLTDWVADYTINAVIYEQTPKTPA